MPSDTTPTEPSPPDAPSRLGAPQAFSAVSFPVLGGALHVTGMPLQDIFILLGGCGALGAATVMAVGGGRRLTSLAGAVLRAAAGR
ncbi:hypothetical protein ACF08M_38955 [Streptomyces sp. NPDC015032]|uniref:hypothetical protein n=1 Tax=Streptomyces sp. NPDC015032 TaxID=3364937 RepID=UPI0036FFB8CE